MSSDDKQPEDTEPLDEDTKFSLSAPPPRNADGDGSDDDEDIAEMTVLLDDDDDTEATLRVADADVADLSESDGDETPTGSEVTELVEDEEEFIDAPGTIEESANVAAYDESDDVFVILPEQMEGEIPVVDTEMVDGAAGVGLLRELPGDGESIDDTGLTEPIDSGFDEFSGEATELVDDDDLDQLASDLDDDDVLIGEDSEGEFSEDESVDDFFDDGMVGAGSSGSFVRWFVGLAATVLIGFGSYCYFVNPDLLGPLKGYIGLEESAPGDATEVVDASDSGKASSGTDEVYVDGENPVGNEGVESSTTEEEVRQAFREKISLALRLGFVGEEGYE